ncbi:hypothetical protein [Solwaraspora sp. WMMA2065]|uniref:hypothetical protein n=1 Tax=Solwaraspora sp. WMMA2065 TaxID=3015166 RepID=UPI00259B57C3|nr:hypothetical protein [Solwaraspora sp. WMMA2065]WJK32430.1 hypothetical protein O7610_16780 [Solwaraspora sp. WMMA2065]
MPQPYGPGQEPDDTAVTMSQLLDRGLPGQLQPAGAWNLPAGEAVILAGDAATGNRIRMCLDVAGISAAVVVLAPSGQLEWQGDAVE